MWLRCWKKGAEGSEVDTQEWSYICRGKEADKKRMKTLSVSEARDIYNMTSEKRPIRNADFVTKCTLEGGEIAHFGGNLLFPRSETNARQDISPQQR